MRSEDSGWNRTTLGEFAPLSYGKGLPQRARDAEGSVPVFGSNGLVGHHSVPYVDGPGIVIGRKGSIGKVHRADGPFWPIDTTFYIQESPERDLRFTYYLLKAMESRLSVMNTDAAVPGLNRDRAHSVDMYVPQLHLQRRIAAVLFAFDELIELNERRIELLEDLARSLYREWFVHFRFPGHQDVDMADSDLGPIPKGWVTRSVGEIAQTITRGIAPKYADDGEWVVVNQRCIRDQRISLAPARQHGGRVSEPKQVQAGDVLINSTGVGTLGRVAWYRDAPTGVTTDSHVSIVRSELDAQPWFAFSLLARQAEFQAMGTGSTGQTELGRDSIGGVRLPEPPRSLIREFDALVLPLVAPLSTLVQAIERLATTRDLLLPRLVSGTLDISELDLGTLTPMDAE